MTVGKAGETIETQTSTSASSTCPRLCIQIASDPSTTTKREALQVIPIPSLLNFAEVNVDVAMATNNSSTCQKHMYGMTN